MEKLTIPKIEMRVTIEKGPRIKIKNSKESYDVFMNLFSQDIINFTEEMILLALNRQNEVYGWYRISSGGTSATICDAKVVFSILLKANASSFLLAHNHPSRSLKPSNDDIELTRNLVKAGRLLDIALLDHLIVSDTGYLSMADEGII
jgi:DNA repair protein RadC